MDVNNLYGWAMPQKLPVNGFKWVKNLSQFHEGFIKSYNEKSKEKYFLEVDFQYSEFWYDCIKLKCKENVKLCYMDTDSFFVYIKTDDIYKDIAKDVETRQ